MMEWFHVRKLPTDTYPSRTYLSSIMYDLRHHVKDKPHPMSGSRYLRHPLSVKSIVKLQLHLNRGPVKSWRGSKYTICEGNGGLVSATPPSPTRALNRGVAPQKTLPLLFYLFL